MKRNQLILLALLPLATIIEVAALTGTSTTTIVVSDGADRTFDNGLTAANFRHWTLE